MTRLVAALVAVSGCAIVVPPSAVEANTLCAQSMSAGQWGDADAACIQALQYQPRYWDALHNSGVIALHRGDRGAARRHFIDALRANQNMRQSANALGAMDVEDGDLTSAAENFNAALRVVPSYFEARRNLGDVRLRQQRFVDAEKEFRQLLLFSDASWPDGWLGLAEALIGQRRYDEAAEVLEKASTLNVDDDEVWLRRARHDERRGRGAQAQESYERCLLANEQNLECVKALKRLTSD